MLRRSLQSYFLVVLAFASLLLQGLASNGEINEPRSVQVANNQSRIILPIAPHGLHSNNASTEIAPADTDQEIEESSTNSSLTSTTENASTTVKSTSTVSTESTESNTQDTLTLPTTTASSSSSNTTTTEKSESTESPTATTDTSTATSTTTASTNSTEETTSSTLPTEETAQSTAGLPSGIIALVMAIVFAVVVVIAYAGLLLWRRYLEYRYGNRELLVNDLEFDTNDLRHFEL